jgi:SAM-dependent methyltransferase
MHPEANQFVAHVKAKFPEYFAGKKVLEVGSLNVNGTVRDFFTDCDYTGIDIAPGNGVDRVLHVTRLLHECTGIAEGSYGPVLTFLCDVMISTEALEHDELWDKSLEAMSALLKPGGILIITCAGPGRLEHGTTKTDPDSSPFTTDYYRNISVEDFRGVLPMSLWADAELIYGRDGEDLYFYGINLSQTSAIADGEGGEMVAEISSIRFNAQPVAPLDRAAER